MTETPRRRSIGRDCGDAELSDDENEVFFGKVTHKERRQAVKYSRRRTVLYIPGFRKDKSLMRYSHEFTPDGPLIYAHEEITETTSMEEVTHNKTLSKKLFPPVSESDYSSSEDKEVVKNLFSTSTQRPVEQTMSDPCSVVTGCDRLDDVDSCLVSSKPVETSSRLMSDSGVDCGVGDSVLYSSKLSEASRIETGITVREKDSKPVLGNLTEDNEQMDDMVFARPQCRNVSAASSISHKSGNVNPAMTNYAGSFLSDMDQTGSVSDASDIDGFKRPSFRLQGVFHGAHTCQTNISTPRVASTVPNLTFNSPHLLVSPIASYKSDSHKQDSDTASTKSSDSTPTKLVPSSVSAFSRYPANTAVRRSLRKKSNEDISDIVLQEPKSETETPGVGAHSGAEVVNTECGKDTNLTCSPRTCRQTECDKISTHVVTPPPKPTMVTSTQSDYLSLPSTLAGQQLLLVKSCELSKGQLESSPESLVSQSSWADLKLSALGINRERLCLATVSSDSSSLPTQSGDTNLTSSSDAAPGHKPDLVTDSDKLLQKSEVTEEEVLQSLDKKLEKDVSSCSPSTEAELGMNSEYFALTEQESTTPDLCKSHRCVDEYVSSDQTQSQTEEDGEEDSDLNVDPSELDTMLPEHEHTSIDYSPVKGRGYERRQRQQSSRPGLVWPNRYMSDSESSETEDTCEQSFDSGSSDSSLLDCSVPDGVDPLSPPSMEAMSVSLNDGKLKPWRPPGYVEAPAKKSTEGKFLSRTGFQARLRKIKEMTVKGSKKGSAFKLKGVSSNKENQINRKYPKSPLPKSESNKSEKDKKKTPCRRKKKSDMVSQTETEIDQMTKLHTMCNGQRVVRYLNFSESPMIIKHYPAPKNPSKLCWNETIANSDLTHHSPIRSPSKTKPKPILTHRPNHHTYPYSEDIPSPIILTRTRRTNTLSHRVTQL